MTDKVHEITDAPKTRSPKAFYHRNKTKLAVAATTLVVGTVFVLGRRSKDFVEAVDVDIDIKTPDES